jgi:AMP-binding enzyme
MTGPTIDALFRARVARSPEAAALADAANRSSFTDGAVHRLSYAQADRAVAAIAARLRGMGLSSDAIVGIQLPNVAENILVLLAVLRAGMIAAPLPLLWRRADAVAALARIGAKALITCGRVGAFNHAQFAMGVAADVFSIRYVCAFGQNLPDGVVPLDDLVAAGGGSPVSPNQEHLQEHLDDADTRLAAITFEVGEGGVVPVARSHRELLAGGMAVARESALTPDFGILSTIAPASFSGICLTLLPWLIGGGILTLHHPFDPGLLAHQQRTDRCGAIVVPGPLAFSLAETGALAIERAASVIAAWRSPEQLAESAAWRESDVSFTDVSIFGEAGMIAMRRDDAGLPCPLLARQDAVELARTEAGTLAVRGALVPHRNFPPGIERSGLPHFKIGADGWIDTGYPCRFVSTTGGLIVTGPPAGMVTVGGYRFPLRDLAEVVRRIDGAATLTALPDPFIGQRLVGAAPDRAIVQAALTAVGVNPIVVAAFRDRRVAAY